ncbi:hypothetical protein Lepto7375DRAFT_1195 [Leptolyngbya sp. PCC 7375]|nr:hypothetical protein Lepto7375DRAFT_1195 [Leptolyngbya sp. PCC 7375]
MLYFLLVWGLLLGASFVTGMGCLYLFKIDSFSRSGHRFLVSSWLGLVILANIFFAIALLIPLSPVIGILILGVCVGFVVRISSIRNEITNILLKISDRWLLIGAAVALLAASLVSKQVTWFDTGLYHFGSIRWIANYGAVPGVALLNNGFAFVSSWFALAAPFNPDFLGSRSTAVLNGYLLFLFLLQGSVSGHYILTRVAKKSDWFVVIYLFLTLPLFVFTPFLSAVLISPSPDLPVILMTGVVAWTILQTSEKPLGHSNKTIGEVLEKSRLTPTHAIVPLILAVGAVTFKLNGLPILGVCALYYGFKNWHQPVSLAIGTGITLLLLSPMVFFGIVTSGCPLYPSSWMCVSAPWALSTQQADNALARINGWQNWFVPPPTDTNVWLWKLNQWLQLSHLNKVMLLLAIVAVPIIIWILWKTNIRKNAADLWLIALSLLGMVFIFSQAPLIRFGLGYFVLLPTLVLSTLCTQIFSSSRCICRVLQPIDKLPKAATFSVLFMASLTFLGFSGVNFSHQFFIPPELPQVTVNLVKVNDVDYFLPENTNKCWGSAIPCVPKQLGNDIWLRNPERGIAAGFIRK